MNCIFCKTELEGRFAGDEPQFYELECPKCGFYDSARTKEDMEKKWSEHFKTTIKL